MEPLTSQGRKLVRLGLVSLRVPEDWRVGGGDDRFWAVTMDKRTVLLTWHEGFAHQGDVEAAIAGAVEQVRSFHETLTVVQPVRVSSANGRTSAFLACDFSDDTDPAVAFRWYVFVPQGEAIVVLRIELQCKPEMAVTADMMTLVEEVDAQVAIAPLYIKGQFKTSGRSLETPPPGTFDDLVERTFFGRMVLSVPARWRCVRRETGYFCRDAEYFGSLWLLVRDGDPKLRDSSEDPDSIVAGLARAMAEAALDENDEVVEQTQLPVSDGAVMRVRARSANLRKAADPDDPPNETVNWGIARWCDSTPVMASILLNVPALLAEEGVYRELVERLDAAVLACRLAGPGDPISYRGPGDPGDYHVEELAPYTIHDFVHICVPTCWNPRETEEGRLGFWADGVENGTLWVDVERIDVDAGELPSTVPGPGLDAPHGTILWRDYDAEEDGDVIRIHQATYFLTDPDIVAKVGGLVLVFFNVVILKELEDHPEMISLVAAMRREIELAHFG